MSRLRLVSSCFVPVCILLLFCMSDSVPVAKLATTVILLLHIQWKMMKAGCLLAVSNDIMCAHTDDSPLKNLAWTCQFKMNISSSQLNCIKSQWRWHYGTTCVCTYMRVCERIPAWKTDRHVCLPSVCLDKLCLNVLLPVFRSVCVCVCQLSRWSLILTTGKSQSHNALGAGPNEEAELAAAMRNQSQFVHTYKKKVLSLSLSSRTVNQHEFGPCIS